jgi:membrane associated rhomboid family serine protease
MPFLPIFDNYPRILLRYPWVTWGVIVTCVLVFLQQVGGGRGRYEEIIYGFGFTPAVFGGSAELPPQLYEIPSALTLVTSMFMHGGWGHLLGNMLYLWIFGDNIEDSMGHGRFIIFYLICGLVATLAHFVALPDSTIPTIGASGAISGVLGAYLVLHPRAKILVPIIIIPLFLPAYLLLAGWIAFQVFSASLGQGDAGGVAWWAHIGGFVAGMILVVPFRYKTVPLFGGETPPKGLVIKRPPPSETGSPRSKKRSRRRPWG